MVRLALAASIAAAWLASPPTASAQFFGFGGARVSQLNVPVKVTGALRVEFRGDEAAGCAAVGLCGVAGTVTWSPGEAGQIGVLTAGKGSRRRTRTVVFLGTGPFGEDATVSHVTRTLPDGSRRLCTDARPTGAVQDRPGIVVTLQGLGILGGRCAGPQPGDIRSALPVRRLRRAALRRPGTRIDLSSDAPFSAGGLSGRVRSTVVLELGRARAERPSDPRRPPARSRRRALIVRYAVERVTGSVRSDLAAVADPRRCDPLDACGLAGSLTRVLDGGRGQATLFASARRSTTSRRELRATLGLAPGPAARVQSGGFGSWRTPAGALVTELGRPDGTPPCRDRVSQSRADMQLEVVNGRLTASLPGFGDLESGGGARTRCPGGEAAEGGPQTVAAGSVPLRALRRRRVTIRLTRGGSGVAQPFRVTTRPDVTIVLRRTRIAERFE